MRSYVEESAGDLGDVWDVTPDALALILHGPRKVEVPAESGKLAEPPRFNT
jgi:hypothetical protein